MNIFKYTLLIFTFIFIGCTMQSYNNEYIEDKIRFKNHECRYSCYVPTTYLEYVFIFNRNLEIVDENSPFDESKMWTVEQTIFDTNGNNNCLRMTFQKVADLKYKCTLENISSPDIYLRTGFYDNETKENWFYLNFGSDELLESIEDSAGVLVRSFTDNPQNLIINWISVNYFSGERNERPIELNLFKKAPFWQEDFNYIGIKLWHRCSPIFLKINDGCKLDNNRKSYESR
mgnify:FL=1